MKKMTKNLAHLAHTLLDIETATGHFHRDQISKKKIENPFQM